jgi:hypothetical protein
MNDAENLSRVLAHVEPAVFRHLMVTKFGLTLPAVDAKKSKTENRGLLATALTGLAVSQRQKLDEEAERIVLLSDGPGQDVIDGMRQDIGGVANREAFAEIRNQYERAIWLYIHDERLFKHALDARQADVFRQSSSCYSGFVAPKGLDVKDDSISRAAFHARAAHRLGCPAEDVAVQIFKRLRPDADTGKEIDLYQISIHHNRPPEVVDRVKDSTLVTQEVVRAVSAHITYEPSNGHLEVLSRETDAREDLGRLVADDLLQSPITGEHIPLKVYSYQSLAAPRHFDISGEPVTAVKVVELGYTVPDHRSLQVKIWAKDVDDIYTAARALITPTFDFRSHHLTYAKISLTTRKDQGERARTINIVLRDDNKCNVKTKREKDRALCDRLLATWGLIREIGDAPKPVDALAA